MNAVPRNLEWQNASNILYDLCGTSPLFVRLNAGTVGSDPTRGMDVFVRILCLRCSVCR
jgi:hypothetical protein